MMCIAGRLRGTWLGLGSSTHRPMLGAAPCPPPAPGTPGTPGIPANQAT